MGDEKNLLDKIKRWYNGTPIIVDIPRDRKRKAVFIGAPFSAGNKYHWSAKIVRALISFNQNHWKWIYPFLATVVFGVLALANKT